jgi:hypothetical protein
MYTMPHRPEDSTEYAEHADRHAKPVVVVVVVGLLVSRVSPKA